MAPGLRCAVCRGMPSTFQLIVYALLAPNVNKTPRISKKLARSGGKGLIVVGVGDLEVA